jgi:iron(III) transport system permease protein
MLPETAPPIVGESPSALRGAGRAVRALVRPSVLITGAVVLLIGWVTLGPLITLVWATVHDGDEFTLGAFADAYSSRGLSTMLWNSALYAVGCTALAMIVGTSLAYLAVRTNVPFKGLVFAASLIPLITPQVLYTISWIYLASPRVGMLNDWLSPVFGPGAIDIFNMWGMIWVEGLHLSPLVFLLMFAAFRSMDPSLEESAIMSGAKRLTVIRRVTAPLVRPAVYASILIMIVRGLESFEVPALIGMPNGIMVFMSEVWRSLSVFPADRGEAGAFSIGLLVLTTLGIYWNSRMTKRSGKSFQTITGKGFRPHAMDLGKWRWPLAGFVVLYFVIAVVLPFFILAYGSLQKFYVPPTWETLTNPSLVNYQEVFSSPATLRAFRNSIVLAVATATAVMFVMAIASWIVVRTKTRGRAILDLLTFLPLTVPGLVLGLAILVIYLRVPLPIYGTLWIMFIAYFTRFMPYGMRYSATSMLQIGAELEESARTSGATWWQIFRRVLLPLIMPGLIAGWIYIVTVSLRELGSSLLLYTPGNEVLSITIWNLWENGRFPAVAALGVAMILSLVVIIVIARRIGGRFGVNEV